MKEIKSPEKRHEAPGVDDGYDNLRDDVLNEHTQDTRSTNTIQLAEVILPDDINKNDTRGKDNQIHTRNRRSKSNLS